MVDIPSESANTVVATPDGESPDDKARETVIPLFEEEFAVSKRVIPKSRVQVSRVTHRHEQLIDELLHHQQIVVERIPVDKPVDVMPSIQDDGETIVVPIVEEVLRVERYLVLKEEVHVRRVRTTDRYQESVTLRKHEAVITRLPIEPPAASLAETQTDAIPNNQENKSHEP
jgi:uncharacterized protein (TIGR02271 family)